MRIASIKEQTKTDSPKSASIKNVLIFITGFGIFVTVLLLIVGLLISLSVVTKKSQETAGSSLYAEIEDHLKYEDADHDFQRRVALQPE